MRPPTASCRTAGRSASSLIRGHAQWRIVSASSFQPNEGEPANAIDGNPDTFWHSRWSPDVAKPPHELVIDLGSSTRIAAVVYTDRVEQANGRVRDYEIYLSEDGKTWGAPAAKGRFGRPAGEHTVQLPAPVTARFLRFVALSEVNNQPYASVAELAIVPGCPGTKTLSAPYQRLGWQRQAESSELAEGARGRTRGSGKPALAAATRAGSRLI